MELKQLRSFCGVVEEGSFTKAAKRLYLSQPTVSTHVRELEEELGTALLIRDTKKFQVTAKGKELYDCACHMLALSDDLLKRWANEDRKIIRIGASTIPSAYILPSVLPQYGAQHPEIYFTVHQSDSEEIIAGMKNGLYDIGMVGMKCEEEGICCTSFYQDRMVVITSVTEYFLTLLRKCRETASPALVRTLLGEPLILRENGSGSGKRADRFLRQLGIAEEKLNIVARINDQESIKNLVAGGLGISIVSERAARNFVEEKRLLQFEPEGNMLTRSLYLLYRMSLPQKSVTREFATYVEGAFR